MWIVVYITQDKGDANNIAGLIGRADILFKLRCVNKASKSDKEVYEILVTGSDVDKAHNIIIDAQA